MFDIAWTELLVVAVIAIIVVGPKELPSMLRAFGKTFGQVRRTAREFQSTFNDALREAERQAGLDDVKKDLSAVSKIDPTKDLRKSLSDTKKALGEKVTDAKFPHPDTAQGAGADKPGAGADKAGAGAGKEASAEAVAAPPAEPPKTTPAPAPAPTPAENAVETPSADAPSSETTPRAAAGAGAERR